MHHVCRSLTVTPIRVVRIAIIVLITTAATSLKAQNDASVDINCAYDKDLSEALGVIIGNEITSKYIESIDPEIFLNALLHQTYLQSDDVKWSLKSQPDAQVLTSNENDSSLRTSFQSPARAEAVLKAWPNRKSMQVLSKKFITAYRTHHYKTLKRTESGLLYRNLSNREFGLSNSEGPEEASDTGHATGGLTTPEFNSRHLGKMRESCQTLRDETWANGTDTQTDVICFQRHRIERKTECQINELNFSEIRFNANKLQVDRFPKGWIGSANDEVIAGWAETLDLLYNLQPGDQSPILEVVIPPELAYQDEHVSDSVKPSEALWFIVTRICPPGHVDEVNGVCKVMDEFGDAARKMSADAG